MILSSRCIKIRKYFLDKITLAIGLFFVV